MIQRVQSIWLLAAAFSLLLLLFIPILGSTLQESEYRLLVSGLHQKTGTMSSVLEHYTGLYIYTILVSLGCFLNVFNYRNRGLQKKIIYLLILLIIGLSFWASRYAGNIPGGIENARYDVGLILPVLAIVCCLLAAKGITKDEQLIRSADRLR